MKRNKGERFEDYKIRRKEANKPSPISFLFVSSGYKEDDEGKLIKNKGHTYRRKIHGELGK